MCVVSITAELGLIWVVFLFIVTVLMVDLHIPWGYPHEWPRTLGYALPCGKYILVFSYFCLHLVSSGPWSPLFSRCSHSHGWLVCCVLHPFFSTLFTLSTHIVCHFTRCHVDLDLCHYWFNLFTFFGFGSSPLGVHVVALWSSHFLLAHMFHWATSASGAAMFGPPFVHPLHIIVMVYLFIYLCLSIISGTLNHTSSIYT